MAEKLPADASAEKRLFIALLTRDIPLVAAFLDLIDNSVNSAVEPWSDRLTTADDYLGIMQDERVTPSVDIFLSVSSDVVSIRDNASGISADDAAKHVFKFGRGFDETHEHDRLSVYGIGLKRAMFKLGSDIEMFSDHVEGGFHMHLNVKKVGAN